MLGILLATEQAAAGVRCRCTAEWVALLLIVLATEQPTSASCRAPETACGRAGAGRVSEEPARRWLGTEQPASRGAVAKCVCGVGCRSGSVSETTKGTTAGCRVLLAAEKPTAGRTGVGLTKSTEACTLTEAARLAVGIAKSPALRIVFYPQFFEALGLVRILEGDRLEMLSDVRGAALFLLDCLEGYGSCALIVVPSSGSGISCAKPTESTSARVGGSESCAAICVRGRRTESGTGRAGRERVVRGSAGAEAGTGGAATAEQGATGVGCTKGATSRRLVLLPEET